MATDHTDRMSAAELSQSAASQPKQTPWNQFGKYWYNEPIEIPARSAILLAVPAV